MFKVAIFNSLWKLFCISSYPWSPTIEIPISGLSFINKRSFSNKLRFKEKERSVTSYRPSNLIPSPIASSLPTSQPFLPTSI